MELNIITFMYLFLRLAPFILVCFFSLASLFNQDFKGLVYLVGLIFACFITIFFGNVITLPAPTADSRIDMCSIITISGTEGLSKLPMGQTVFGFTYAYLLFAIIPNLVTQNIATIVFFPILILFDMWWNFNNSCYSFWQLLLSLVIGGMCGWLWGYIIDSTKTDSLKYFSGLNNNEQCSAPAKTTFRCKVYKGKKLMTTL